MNLKGIVEPKLKVSESYVVAIDITNDDVPVVTVAKQTSRGMAVINLIQGLDAENLYTDLLGSDSWKKEVHYGGPAKTSCR